MRVLAGALLAMLAAGPNLPGADALAVTLAAHPVATTCAVATTATITAYEADGPRAVTYRFTHSDGSSSPPGHLTFTGDGTVAQSVTDTWTPRGTKPWTALEILAPQNVRTPHINVTSRCTRGVVAATR